MTQHAHIPPSEEWRKVIRSLCPLNEGPWRWTAGIQAGLASGNPLAVFTIAGHQTGGLLASLGAFTALYCAQLRLIDRLRALPCVGLELVVASAIGTLTSANVWLTVVGFIINTVLGAGIAMTVLFTSQWLRLGRIR